MKINDLYGKEVEISQEQQKYWTDILDKITNFEQKKENKNDKRRTAEKP